MPVTDLSYVTVTATFKRPDNTAAQGSVEFRPSTRVVNTTTNQTVLPDGLSVQLDSSGSISVSLPCTDDPDFSPIGWTYEVRELVDSNPRTYNILLPASPSTVDLADVIPTDSALFPYVRYMTGLLAARPAATAYVGLYNATDDNGGTLYYSDGATWSKVAPGQTEVSGRELAYAQTTSNFSTAQLTEANRVDTGLIITPTVADRPIIVEFFGSVLNTIADSGAILFIVENVAGNANNTPILQKSAMFPPINNGQIPFTLRARLAPAAGVHSYKVMCCAFTSGLAGWEANSEKPAFLRAYEC